MLNLVIFCKFAHFRCIISFHNLNFYLYRSLTDLFFILNVFFFFFYILRFVLLLFKYFSKQFSIYIVFIFYLLPFLNHFKNVLFGSHLTFVIFYTIEGKNKCECPCACSKLIQICRFRLWSALQLKTSLRSGLWSGDEMNWLWHTSRQQTNLWQGFRQWPLTRFAPQRTWI